LYAEALFPRTSSEPDHPRPKDDLVEERRFTFDGYAYWCRVAHQSAPVTEPLLILGGSAQDRYAWARHERWLRPRCTVITADLPGFGEADFLPARYGIDFLAAAVRDLLDSLGLDEVNLYGGCFGGLIALRVAQHYPRYLRRLALSGVTKTIPNGFAERSRSWAAQISRGELDGGAATLLEQFMAPPRVGEICRRSTVERLLSRQFVNQSAGEMRMLMEHNARLVLHEIYRDEPLPAVPALVFTGEHDTLTTPSMGRAVATSLPLGRFVTISDSDHLVHLERSKEFAELLGLFVTDRPLDGLPYCGRGI
jgi:pimeloyl-ACP methyl ester carboxylesterase